MVTCERLPPACRKVNKGALKRVGGGSLSSPATFQILQKIPSAHTAAHTKRTWQPRRGSSHAARQQAFCADFWNSGPGWKTRERLAPAAAAEQAGPRRILINLLTGRPLMQIRRFVTLLF